MEYSPGDPPDIGSGFIVDLNTSLPFELTTAFSLYNASDQSEPEQPLWVTGLKSTCMLFVIISAIFGNILVIISVFRFRNLRIISNFFIMSLAFADLLVAVLVMPFSASQEIVGHWVFSVLACDIFNANDVLFSTASLLHLCCISMDRYIAITDPFHYEQRMTRTKVAIMLTCAWGASALISHIPVHTGLYTTETIRNATSVYNNVCIFDVNKIYAIISSTISFWIPTFIMVFTYIMIFREARRQEKRLMELTKLTPSSVTRSISFNSREQSDRITTQNNGTLASNGDMDVNGNGYQNSTESEPRRLSRERNKIKREHKAAKTLGIIMGCFLLCWLPFFLWYVITTICGDELCPTPLTVSGMLFWIGYFNSALNPMIYAFFNKDFRKAFLTLLRCQRLSRACGSLQCCHCCSSCCCDKSASCCCRRASRGSEKSNLHSPAFYTEMETRSTRPSLAPSQSTQYTASSPQNRSVLTYNRTYDTVD